eukprot:2534944-Alexandrium_andersonii.AAC.1
MSASLVGSEMCIRDRGAREASSSDCCVFGGAEFGLRQQGADTVCCVVAVSYTHLTLPTICSV